MLFFIYSAGLYLDLEYYGLDFDFEWIYDTLGRLLFVYDLHSYFPLISRLDTWVSWNLVSGGQASQVRQNHIFMRSGMHIVGIHHLFECCKMEGPGHSMF